MLSSVREDLAKNLGIWNLMKTWPQTVCDKPYKKLWLLLKGQEKALAPWYSACTQHGEQDTTLKKLQAWDFMQQKERIETFG